MEVMEAFVHGNIPAISTNFIYATRKWIHHKDFFSFFEKIFEGRAQLLSPRRNRSGSDL